jgi:TnpA family transposase
MSTVADSHRLVILTAQEIDELYGLPRFSDDDRQLHFALSPAEHAAINSRRPPIGVHLALELGYFKAKRQFFRFEPSEVAHDLRYLIAAHFPGLKLASVTSPSKPTRIALQRTILELTGYGQCDASAQQALQDKARRIAMLSTQPMYILRECLQYLCAERVVAPKYTTLQDLVGHAVTHERNRVSALLDRAMPPAVAKALHTLLESDEQMYRISALKHEAKDFSHKELKGEVQRRQVFQPLHHFAGAFLTSAGLSSESSRYYASLVKFYSVSKLRRIPQGVAQLYLLYFAYQRFRQINDNLVEAFIHLVRGYEKQAKVAAEEAMQQAMLHMTNDLNAAGQVLRLFIDPGVASDRPFSDVQDKAFALLGREQFSTVSDYLRKMEFDKVAYQWAHYTRLSHAIKRNVRHVFCELNFGGRVEDAPLLEAVTFLQKLLRDGQSPRQVKPEAFPQRMIPKTLRPYLYAAGDTVEGTPQAIRLDVDRYEFLVYRLLRNALEAGDVYVQHSNEFRRFEDDLISDERWKNRDAILSEIGAPLLLAPIEDTLKALREALEDRFAEVNRRIEESANEHIRIRGRGDKRRWSLMYPTAEEPVNSPFYGQLPGIGIADLLWFVAARTSFLDGFTHVLERYVKHAPDARQLLACVVALGTNMGLWKMVEVSGLTFASLQGTARNYLRAGNLAHGQRRDQQRHRRVAGVQAVRHPGQGAFQQRRPALRNADQDPQRLNARHSPKYFGLQKGVSACTLVANHVPINARIIGTQEHESHFVFDLLYNNTSDIKPSHHSTDTHGTNQVNFWILRVFGYGFAPRYKNLRQKTQTLVGFENPTHYADMLIQPSRKVFEDLIIAEWPNILRIMASLGQKDVTQATIVRKLSSYLRQNQTKKALWELDNICRTLYVLDFIDDVDLRQAVQRALNRGEAYHRFRRAVAYVNAGAFRVKTEAEQELWNECSRLIANAVSFYNTALLSKVYEQKLVAEDWIAIGALRRISPVAWQHVNLFGNFEFSEAGAKVDLDALAALYAEAGYWNQALSEDVTEPVFV